MKPKYIGTKLDDPDYLAFGITAAKQGTSKSALLKSLIVEFIKNSPDGNNSMKCGPASESPGKNEGGAE